MICVCTVLLMGERLRLWVLDRALDARAGMPVGVRLVVVWECVCCVRAEKEKKLCACLLRGGWS